jgi:hypothetical protein
VFVGRSKTSCLMSVTQNCLLISVVDVHHRAVNTVNLNQVKVILKYWPYCGCNRPKHVAVSKIKRHLSSKDSQRFIVEAKIFLSRMLQTSLSVLWRYFWFFINIDMAMLFEVLADVSVKFALSGNVSSCTWLWKSWGKSNSPSWIFNNVSEESSL